ncbi:MAG TPA: Sec-independent protein translocase protein TatB [Herpetosiphonaceae bacterium]
MFGIGFTELIIILIVALLVVGPERLPEMARQLGTIVRDLRRMYNNLRADLGPEFDEIEQGIRDLRSLNPREQVRNYGRSLLDDLSKDAPEINEAKDLAYSSRADLEAASRQLLRDDLLDRPLRDTLKSEETSQPASETTSSSETATGTDTRSDRTSHATAANGSAPIETTGHFE